jgi:hypothetical protein
VPKYRFSSASSIFAAAFMTLLVCTGIQAQPPRSADTAFRVGERITYSVSFDKYSDVAYAEIYTASRGALSGKDAVELRAKFKTLNFFSAAFYQVDEVRTTYAAPDTGMPLFVSRTENPDGIPKETNNDYLKTPAVNFDLVTLIYKIRHSGGSGAANFQEGEKVYGVTFQPSGTENVRTAAGSFDTTIVTVQSEYFTELGFSEIRINLSNDEARVPVVVRMKKTKKSEFRAEATTVQMMLPEPAATPTPAPTNTPRSTPTPVRTPEPYIANQPLAPELAFELGESLEYRIAAGGRPVGTCVMRARERRQINGADTLVLAATVTNSIAGNPILNLNDSITVNANPESLAPRQIEIRLSGGLSSINQTAVFDALTGAIIYNGTNRVEAPIGTHSILSLIYAMRSFNLKPSKTLNNPVNDTRVAVFWASQPYVFTLRPSAPETITIGEEKVSAQLITINTGNPQLDQLSLKVWLSNDGRRIPLRFSAGVYQADLVSASNILPK